MWPEGGWGRGVGVVVLVRVTGGWCVEVVL